MVENYELTADPAFSFAVSLFRHFSGSTGSNVSDWTGYDEAITVSPDFGQECGKKTTCVVLMLRSAVLVSARPKTPV